MQTITLHLGNHSMHSIVRLLAQYNTNCDTHLVVAFRPGFAHSDIYPVLSSFVNEIKSNGRNYTVESIIDKKDDRANYASRIDFFKHIGINFDEYFKRYTSSNFIEITNAPKNCYGLSTSFSKVFNSDFGLSQEESSIIGFFIDEMVTNVTMHSKGNSGAYFYCQKYKTREGLEIIIADSGIGIKNSLERINPNQSNDYYLKECIKFEVTNGEGRGHGLYFISEFIRRNDGIFELWSGENYLKIWHGYEAVHACSMWKGVILKLLIKFDVKVTLNDLFKEKDQIPLPQ